MIKFKLIVLIVSLSCLLLACCPDKDELVERDMDEQTTAADAKHANKTFKKADEEVGFF